MGLIYGVNPVKEAIESGKTINKLYGSKGSKEVYELLKLAKSKGIVTVEADKIKLDKMITTEGEKLKNSQGIVASVTDYEYYEIEDILEYANSKVEGKKILFNMTTNGTLLSDKVVDFLSRYNFSISISLDGSKEEHDRNRKFKDGRGSFDVIIENLRNIREKYPELDKRIQIMTTINP
ncbi:MAG: hypothetical protein IKL08_04310, partial [Clostridia bacterium]|nr:hypothetical protein [Clostridia bacterium]